MTPSVVTVEIGGVDVTSMVEGGGSTLALTLRQNDQRSTGNITLRSIDGSWRPDDGQEIVIREDGAAMFTGSIDQVTETRAVKSNGDANIWLACLLVDLSARLDAIFFRASFENLSTGVMALYIMSTFGAFETIIFASVSDGGFVDDGPTIVGPVPFDWGSISAALDWLATTAGKIWFIDADRNLHMQDRLATDAPFSITDSSLNWTSLSVQRSRADYVNSSLTKLNFHVTGAISQSFTGDGTTRAFTLSVGSASVGSGFINAEGIGLVNAVQINGGPVLPSVGLTGSGAAWTYDVGGHSITQDPGQPVLTGSDTLGVSFQQLGDDSIRTSVDDAIAARALVEGNSGIYTRGFSDDTHNHDAGGARDSAAAVLAPQAVIPTVITIGMDGPVGKPRPGMVVTVGVTLPLVSGSFLVQDVTATFQTGMGFRYVATAIDGRRVPNWVDYFKGLASGGGGSVVASGGSSGGGSGDDSSVTIGGVVLTY